MTDYAIVGTVENGVITPDPLGVPILVGRYQRSNPQRYIVHCADGLMRAVGKRQRFVGDADLYGAQPVLVDAVPEGQRIVSEELVNDAGTPRLQRVLEIIDATETPLSYAQWEELILALPQGQRTTLVNAVQAAENGTDQSARFSARYLRGQVSRQLTYGTVLLALSKVGITGVEQPLADRWQAAIDLDV